MHFPDTAVISKPGDPRPEEVQEEISKILNSRSFGHSPVLQSFLRFVTEETIHGRASEVSEYTIATQALGRGADFDSTSDTIVRTQAYRLRQKLNEYYASEGHSDALLIEVPKGHYIPSFRFRVREETEDDAPHARAPELGTALEFREPMSPQRIARWHWLMLALLFGALGMGALLRFSPLAASDSHAVRPSASPVDSFWQSFLQSDREPLIAYTNSLCLITDSGDQIAYSEGATGDRGTAVDPVVAARLKKKHELNTRGNLYFEDSFTGVGDVLAVTAISNAVIRAGGQPSLKRGRLLSTYDLEKHNVIFVGSPFVNEVLNDLPSQAKFVFRHGSLLWTGSIDDTAPAGASERSYKVERSAESGVLLTDYAVVSCLRGLKPNREILVVAGLTTSGTAAAAQFATSPDGIAEMSRRLHRTGQNGQPWPKYFEFLIKAQLSHGLDVIHAECVASHAN